jgi:hypothetical protein
LELLRGLIERIEVTPTEQGLQIELIGETVGMVELGLDAKQAALPAEAACSVKQPPTVRPAADSCMSLDVRGCGLWPRVSLSTLCSPSLQAPSRRSLPPHEGGTAREEREA